YISGMVMTVGWLARELHKPRPLRRGLTIAGIALTCGIGIVLTVAAHEMARLGPVVAYVSGEPTPENPSPLRRFDPTCRLRGWHVLGAEVDRARAELRQRGIEAEL